MGKVERGKEEAGKKKEEGVFGGMTTVQGRHTPAQQSSIRTTLHMKKVSSGAKKGQGKEETLEKCTRLSSVRRIER